MKRLASSLLALMLLNPSLSQAETFQYAGQFQPVSVRGKSCGPADMRAIPVVVWLDIEQGQWRSGLMAPIGPNGLYYDIRIQSPQTHGPQQWKLDLPYPGTAAAPDHPLTLNFNFDQPGQTIEGDFVPRPDDKQACQSSLERLTLTLERKGSTAASAYAKAKQGHAAALESGKLFAQLGNAKRPEAFALNQRRLELTRQAYGPQHVNVFYTLQRLGFLAGKLPDQAARSAGYWQEAGELAEKIAPELAGKSWLDAARDNDPDNLVAHRRFLEAAVRWNPPEKDWPTRGADLRAASIRLANHLEKQADKLEDDNQYAAAADLLWEAAGLVHHWAPDMVTRRAALVRLSARALSGIDKPSAEQRSLALSRASLALALARDWAKGRDTREVHTLIATSLNLQGMVFSNLGLASEGMEAYTQAIAELGADPDQYQQKSRSTYRLNLSSALRVANRFPEAIAQMRLSLADLKAVGGDKSRGYVEGLTSLAFMYQEMGQDLVEEIEVRKQTIALIQSLPGYDPFNDDNLIKRVRLVERLQYAGRPLEALQTLTPLLADLRSAAQRPKSERRQHYELARSLTIQYKLQRDSGADSQALASMNEAIAILDRIDGRMAVKNLWFYDLQAEAMLAANLPAPGIDLLRQTLALKIKEASTPREDILQARIRLAQVLPVVQRWPEAEEMLKEAQAEALKHFPLGHDIRARVFSTRADLLARQTPPRFEDALRAQESSCKEREATQPPDPVDLNNCLLVLSSRYSFLDRLSDSKRTVDRVAARVGQERKDPLKGSAITLSYLGYTYTNLGRWDDARSALEDALAINRSLRGPDHFSLAQNWTQLGQIELWASRPGPAIKHFEEAIRIRKIALGDERSMNITLATHLATALMNAGRKADALALAEKALELARRDRVDANDQAMAQYTYGNLLRQNGRPTEAIASLHRAIAQMGSSLRLGNRIKAFDALSQAYWADKQAEAAILFGKLALNASQQLREKASDLDKSDQDSLREVHATAYRRIAGWMIDKGRIAEAQQVLTMLKDQEYSDFTRGGEDTKPGSAQARLTPAESPWATRYEQIQAQLGRISFEIGNLQRKRDGGFKLSAAEELQWQSLSKDQEVASRAFDAALLDMGKTFTDQQARRATTERIESDGALQETLGQLSGSQASGQSRQVALIHYLVGPDQTRILVTTPDLRIARVSNVGQVEINRLVAAFRQSLQNPASDPKPLAQQLYNALIKPVEADLQGARSSMLMLSLDGTLRYLPFAALHDGKQYLIERFGLAMDTAAARDRLRETSTVAPRVWALGLTRAVPGFSALAGVQRELDGIVGTDGARGKAMFDEAFTESALQLGLQQRYPVLHIASHFKFMPGSEESSFLLLGDGTHLTLDDIRHRVRFQGTDLLTLSACETGVGGGADANGREVEGLGALAQKRGARAVLATLWPVADSSTAQLMQNMYASRSDQKLSKAEALRQAQIGLLSGAVSAGTSAGDPDRGARAHGNATGNGAASTPVSKAWAHPYYWAPFILMGNWL